jgi:Xaa-Pro dipeptidase
MNQRLTRFSNWLKDQEHSFAFLTTTANVFYLSKFHTDPHERLVGLAAFPDEEPFIICPSMEVPQVQRLDWKYEIIGYSDTDNPWDKVKEALKKRNICAGTIAIEKAHMNVERSEELQRILPGSTFTSAETKLNELRLIKEENEIHVLREAAKLADFGVEVGVQALEEGKTEMEVLATIEFELKKKGIRQMSFSTMVLTGENTADPHGNPGMQTIKNGDLVLFDLGVVLDGYCSDITRTVAFGEPNEHQKHIYDTVLKAQLAALDACKPGTPIRLIDRTAREIIETEGYGQYFTHRIGHGLGIDVHEYPSMNAINETPLRKGMAFTVEPGIYLPGVGGVRIEDDLLITANGVESMTKFPKELQIIKR